MTASPPDPCPTERLRNDPFGPIFGKNLSFYGNKKSEGYWASTKPWNKVVLNVKINLDVDIF